VDPERRAIVCELLDERFIAFPCEGLVLGANLPMGAMSCMEGSYVFFNNRYDDQERDSWGMKISRIHVDHLRIDGF
jgi:hypothetical protein